jgi:AcrR family transcriptional regulator
MPRFLDPHGRTDAIVDGACRVILRRGLCGFTLRAIAAESGISASSLVHQFTDRDRLVRTLVALIGRRRVDHIGRRAWTEGGLAFLPSEEEEFLDARVWLACCELGRGAADVGAVVAAVRLDERKLMDVLTEGRLGETGLDVVMAVVDGLTVAMCALEDALSAEGAKAALLGVLPPPRPSTEGYVRSSA